MLLFFVDSIYVPGYIVLHIFKLVGNDVLFAKLT